LYPRRSGIACRRPLRSGLTRGVYPHRSELPAIEERGAGDELTVAPVGQISPRRCRDLTACVARSTGEDRAVRQRDPSRLQPRMLDSVVPDDEFVAMVARANGFRSEVATFGFGGSAIDSHIRARLYWNPKIPELAAGHEVLANEIHALLNDSRLSAPQAAQLEREYFPRRG
jgi:hypothetical protein